MRPRPAEPGPGPRREAGLPSFPALAPRTWHPDRHPHSGWEAGLVVASAATCFSPVDGSSCVPHRGPLWEEAGDSFLAGMRRPAASAPRDKHARLPRRHSGAAALPVPSPSARACCFHPRSARAEAFTAPRPPGRARPWQPPSPSVSPGRPLPSQARPQRRPPWNLHPSPRPVPTPKTRPWGGHAPGRIRGGQVGHRGSGWQAPGCPRQRRLSPRDAGEGGQVDLPTGRDAAAAPRFLQERTWVPSV